MAKKGAEGEGGHKSSLKYREDISKTIDARNGATMTIGGTATNSVEDGDGGNEASLSGSHSCTRRDMMAFKA